MEVIEQYIVPLAVSNLIFGLALLTAVKRPMYARIFFVVCFVGASGFNVWTAISNPGAYLTYADLAIFNTYRNFISGFFADYVQGIVIMIAFGQLLVGLGLMLNKTWLRAACLGGITFGLAIAPLGIGSGFPSTILMAIAFYALFKNDASDFIWKWNQYNRSQENQQRRE